MDQWISETSCFFVVCAVEGELSESEKGICYCGGRPKLEGKSKGEG